MQNVSIQRAEDLSQAVRSALESLLGRTLEADEEISIMAYRPHEVPQGPMRDQLAQILKENRWMRWQNESGMRRMMSLTRYWTKACAQNVLITAG